MTDQPQEPLRSVHTTNFPAILEQLGISLVVSTYQAGRLVLLRADEGKINTHFRMFNRPMGVAADRERLTVGTAAQIWYMRNIPAVGQKLTPPDKHDACYVPRDIHVTGDIDIHEMAWGDEFPPPQPSPKGRGSRTSSPPLNPPQREGSQTPPLNPPQREGSQTPSPSGGGQGRGKVLWFVNTKFSCLCNVDHEHSFIPRWRPPFVTALALEDRCHLNGLALAQGLPRYVTMLGETDTAGGWRANKANGGLLMDLQSNKILARGLSMPHSPRLYDGKLWFLESGQGSLAWFNPEKLHYGDHRAVETVIQLPGFTRGLDFYGPLAFIGLSQVRESATFSNIPIVERLTERICGVWVVNIVTREVVAFLRFEDAVQEIFAVQVLAGIRFPEMLEWNDELVKSSYVLPDEALKAVKI